MTVLGEGAPEVAYTCMQLYANASREKYFPSPPFFAAQTPMPSDEPNTHPEPHLAARQPSYSFAFRPGLVSLQR